MKLLVTGGSGFIGRAVCALAVERGLAVTSLSRHGASLPTHTPTLEQVTWRKGSVFDAPVLESAVNDVGAVVHCVGIGRERAGKDETFKRLNGDSAIVVAEAAKKAGVMRLASIFRAPGPRFEANTPVRVEVVARAVLRAVLDPTARGVIEPTRIAGFAEVALTTASSIE